MLRLSWAVTIIGACGRFYFLDMEHKFHIKKTLISFLIFLILWAEFVIFPRLAWWSIKY
jgi:hypothetical protein